MSRADRNRGAPRGWWKLLPLLPVLILLAGGIAFTVGQSLALREGGLSLAAYGQALRLPNLGRNLLFSLSTAAASASLATAAGTGLAYLLWRLPGTWRRWGIGFYLPLILPHVAVGFLTLFWFGQTGVIASVFNRLGLPGFYRSPLFRGDGAGIIIAYLYKSAPFALVLTLPVLRRISPSYLQTARMLGAGELRSFSQIILPRLAPAMGSVWIILFVYSFGAYDLPFVIGESSPRMISLYLYRLYFFRPIHERPIAAALLALVFFMGVAMVMLYSRAAAGVEQRERRL